MPSGSAPRFGGDHSKKLAPLVVRIGPEKQQFRVEPPGRTNARVRAHGMGVDDMRLRFVGAGPDFGL